MSLLMQEPEVGTQPVTDEIEQGVIEDARRRRRRRRLRAGLAAALLVAAGVALILSYFGGGASHPDARLGLSQFANSPSSASHTRSGPGLKVFLSPTLTGGQAGWCVMVEFSWAGGGSCSALPTSTRPLFEETYFGGRTPTESEFVALADPQVSSVRLASGRVVRTIGVALPYGLKAVAVPLAVRRPRSGALLPSNPLPRATALDAAGHPVAEGPLTNESLPNRSWQRPRQQAKGACELTASGVNGLTAAWGHVATVIHPVSHAIIGRGFVSCVDTEYYLGRWALRAALLLDAARPGALPAAIPGLAPIKGAHGLYGGEMHFQGFALAKRWSNAWIVVAGGGPTRGARAARERLLSHLTASISGLT
jgi:hypothetical protein